MSVNVSVIAEIKNNKPALSEYQKTKINKAFALSNGKMLQITVSNIKKDRSTNQNAYYWGVVLRMIAEETGYTPDDMHEYFKLRFMPKNIIQIKSEKREVPFSTTKLQTNEFEMYLEQIRAFAAEELQIVIPLPNENL